ncbi:MAG: hypothetical protein RIS88_1074 [Pseudomonadota bacterium]|jgi:uncharacterized MAPEG superfamily protein
MTVPHFTVSYGCLLVAALLPIVCAGLAKQDGFGRPRREGGYDNVNPRAWQARQEGRAAWAYAAQANSFEALPLFVAAVLVAHQMGANQALADALSVAFVTLRIVYIGAYVGGRASLRSLVWVLALGVNIALLFSGLF